MVIRLRSSQVLDASQSELVSRNIGLPGKY